MHLLHRSTVGYHEIVDEFAKQFNALAATSSSSIEPLHFWRHERVHRCTELNTDTLPTPESQLTLEIAKMDDLDTILDMLPYFQQKVLTATYSREESRRMILPLLEKGKVYFLKKDNQIVSMASSSREALSTVEVKAGAGRGVGRVWV
jgi:hypothetical protein